MARPGRRLAWLSLAILVAACSTPGKSTAPGIVADSKMTLEVANGTDRALELHVNGSKVAEIAAHGGVKLKANDLPDLPWDAVLHFAGGRRIVSLTVHSGDVHVLENSSRGIGARVDLSCGRIDLWSGPPVSGPPPGPGSPGDCNP